MSPPKTKPRRKLSWAHKHQPWRRVTSWFRHTAEALLMEAIFAVFASLSVDRASGLGGWLGRKIGPRLGVSNRAFKHLAMVFPEKSEAERYGIMVGMWDNLGRTLAEYPHLPEIVDEKSGRLEIVDEEPMIAANAAGKPFIVLAGHFANFELMTLAAYRRGLNLTVISRPINNPKIQKILIRFRRAATGHWDFIPKGPQGARQVVQLLQDGLNLGILVDQRTTQGVALDLMGHKARTSLGPAKLMLEHDCPMLTAHIERLGGAYFRLVVGPPFAVPNLDNRQAAAEAIMTEVNATLETWIRARPEDWLWLHRRWDRP